MTPDPILSFFRGTGTDHAGRRHADILAWSDGQLEAVHDYIQWLFPLRKRSRFNPGAPLLSPETIAAFHEDGALRDTLLAGFRRMAAFYGLAIRDFDDGTLQLDLAPEFDARARVWLTPGNHNFLRITRILTSLRTLGCRHEAESLGEVLDLLYRRSPFVIGERTHAFWRSAAGGA
jgi:hypothetical protein